MFYMLDGRGNAFHGFSIMQSEGRGGKADGFENLISIIKLILKIRFHGKLHFRKTACQAGLEAEIVRKLIIFKFNFMHRISLIC